MLYMYAYGRYRSMLHNMATTNDPGQLLFHICTCTSSAHMKQYNNSATII